MRSKIIFKIILAELSNEATFEELTILNKWLEESDGNKEEYARIKQLYKQFSTTSVRKYNYNVDNAWRHISDKLGKKKVPLTMYLRYVAIIIIILSVGLFIKDFYPKQKQTPIVQVEDINHPTLVLDNGETISLDDESFLMKQNDVVIKNEAGNKLFYKQEKDIKINAPKNNHLIIPKGKIYQLVLSDGTQVWLNSETELTYPTQFTSDKREVTLRGEAFFKVTKNDKKPFYVKTEGMDIKVLGTSFNVSCYNQESIVSATLVEGAISVKTKSGEERTITPSEQITYDKEQSEVRVQTVDTELYTSWTKGIYIFKDVPLNKIISNLQRWYDFSVSYQSDELKNKHFSITMDRSADLDQLLEVISYTSEIKLERVGNNVSIKKGKEDKEIKRIYTKKR